MTDAKRLADAIEEHGLSSFYAGWISVEYDAAEKMIIAALRAQEGGLLVPREPTEEWVLAVAKHFCVSQDTARITIEDVIAAASGEKNDG